MHEIEPKDVAVSVVVYNNQMFLRIIVGKEQVDLPYHGTGFPRTRGDVPSPAQA